MHWVKTLGSIQWDFIEISMTFKLGEETVMLQGIKTDSVNILVGIKGLKSNFVKKTRIVFTVDGFGSKVRG